MRATAPTRATFSTSGFRSNYVELVSVKGPKNIRRRSKLCPSCKTTHIKLAVESVLTAQKREAGGKNTSVVHRLAVHAPWLHNRSWTSVGQRLWLDSFPKQIFRLNVRHIFSLFEPRWFKKRILLLILIFKIFNCFISPLVGEKLQTKHSYKKFFLHHKVYVIPLKFRIIDPHIPISNWTMSSSVTTAKNVFNVLFLRKIKLQFSKLRLRFLT